MESFWKSQIKREYLVSLINKLKVCEPSEPIVVPEKLKGFGTIIHDMEKCVSCGSCTNMCEDNAIYFLKNFDLNRLKKLPSDSKLENRKILADLINKLKVKEPQQPISVPEGLRGFGTIELNPAKCIFCEECYRVCRFEAISKESRWNLPKILKLYNSS